MRTRIALPDYYEIETSLGEGSFSVLYRARDLRDGTVLALKALKSIAWLRPAENQARARYVGATLKPLQTLRHAALPVVFEMGCRDSTFYMAREYLDGRSLRSLVSAGGRLFLSDAARFADRLGSAIDLLHRFGVTHGAVSAENVLISPQGSVFLTDAGFGPTGAGFKLAGFSLGVKQRQPQRDDVAEMAGLVYYALTGRAPWLFGIRPVRDVDIPPAVLNALKRAWLHGSKAYAKASDLAAVVGPQDPANLLQVAWKPAAAVSLFALLATAGGNAYSEKVALAQARPRPAPQRIVPPQTNPMGLPDSEFAAVHDAILWQGPAALATPSIAGAFALSEEQRISIQNIIRDQRELIGAVVELSAEGRSEADADATMRSLRATTGARILAELTEAQRVRWDAVARWKSQP